MPFAIDHDYHIHSHLSLCSQDPEETTEKILAAAREQSFSEICLTDHFWDSTVAWPHVPDWYRMQDFDYISASLPLPQDENVRFYFGCETELGFDGTLGISREKIDKFDFVIIPTTHLHLTNVAILPGASLDRRAELWVERFDAVLSMDLPFEKIGIAHLTCPLIANVPSANDPNDTWSPHIEVLKKIPDKEMHRLFALAAKRGVGIELNTPGIDKYSEEQRIVMLHPYRIAKEEGCLFYFGSDAHHPAGLYKAKHFAQLATLLDLDERDRFKIKK